MTQLEKALALCKEAHKGQFRRDGVTPYETHPIAVAELVSTEEEKIVALLHDVLEDTDGNYGYIKEEFGQKVFSLVLLMTKQKHERYDKYIGFIKGHKTLINVKIADMFHNLTCNPSEKQKKKYFEAMKLLREE